jgi:hypothetical protein
VQPTKSANEEVRNHSSFDFYLALTAAGIALIALLLYPSFYRAIGRGRQMGNMSEMREIGNAVEAYYVDHKSVPIGKSNIAAVREKLEGNYVDVLPLKDRWGNEYLYQSDGIESYTIISYGKDHELDGPLVYRGPITRFTNDIVFSNGNFISFAEGT